MFNEYNSKRKNTTNYLINNNSKQIQVSQPNNYRRNLISTKSPSYIRRYRYEHENQTPYMSQNQIHYKVKRPEIHLEERRNNDNTMKNLKIKPDYYFSGFPGKENTEKQKDFVQKSVNTFTNQYQNKLDTNLEKNNKNNLVISQKENEVKIINFKDNKDNKDNNFRIIQGNKSPKNIYRNNPLIKTTKFHTNLKIEKEDNSSMPVAQKICNIIIKGGTKKAKKDKKKQKKNYLNNIEIEGNVAQGSAIPEKKTNINNNNNDEKKNLSSLPIKNDVDKNKYYNNKKNDNEIKEKRVQINEERKPILKEKNVKKDEKNDKISKNKEIIKKLENNNYNQKNNTTEKQEIFEEDEEEELEDDEEHNNEENGEQYEEEEEGDNNKRDIEELEEEEQHDIQLSKKNVKKTDLQLQKENEIKLDGIKEKEPKMQIEKFQVFQESNKKEKPNNIINDDNIELIGKKKPLILQMNNESNIELVKNNPVSIIKVQKAQSLGQPIEQQKKSPRKQIFKIIKNRENDVDINHDNVQILKMQKVQNFAQPRDKKRKIKNKNIKFKISKAKDNNFILERITEEPQLKIVKAIIYKQQTKPKKKIIKKKNIKFKICHSKDNNFILEKIMKEPNLEIENVIIYNEQPQEIKNVKINYEINQIKDCNFMLEKIKKIDKKPEIKIDNAINYIAQYGEQNKDKSSKINNKNSELTISKIKDNEITLGNEEVEPKLKIENSIKYEQDPIVKAKNTKKTKYKISKVKDGNIEIISIPSIFITKENYIELKNKYNRKNYKKSNYQKLKISRDNTYQYNSIQVVNDAITAPKESRFIIKGNLQQNQQKPKTITREEITYCYKSPIIQKNNELSIEGNIKNAIMPTINNNNIGMDKELDNNNNVNNKKKSFKSNSMRESTNQQSIKKEVEKKYKISTFVSSNLSQSENEENQQKITDNNILKEKANNFKAGGNEGPSSNDLSKDKEQYSIDNGGVKMSNMISPIKNEEKNNNENEDKNELEKNNQIITNNFEQNNQSNLVKSENNNTGKTQSHYFNKTYNNKNGIPKTPVHKEKQKSHYNKSKSHTITLISYNQESKNMGRTYITSKLTPRGETNEGSKNRDNSSNISRVYINRTNHRNKNDNKRKSSNSVNTVYISTNIRRNMIEDTEQNKSDLNDNSYTSNTFNRKKSEPRHFTNKYRPIKSPKEIYSNNKNEVKTNINIINANSEENSSIIVNKLENKTIEGNDINEAFNNLNSSSIDKDINTKNISETENITNNNNEKEFINSDINIEEKVEDYNDKNENKDESKAKNENKELNKDNSNNIFGYNETKVEDFNTNIDTFNFGNSELSEYTKSYLNSYMHSSRPELSDFSKQFLTSDITTTTTNDRPELSNITRAYLISQTPIDDEK